MIETVIFDCDGVILESTDIKTAAFQALFEADHPERVAEILAYHAAHMGISRFVKFRHICTEILGEPFTRGRAAQLAQDFSRLVLDRVLACPLVRGAREFLRSQAGRRPLYLASGTPQAELELILERRRLRGHFAQVWGAPAKKPAVIRQVLRRLRLRPGQAVFVGDAESDWRAAQETGVHFVRRTGSPAQWSLPPCPWEVPDLSGLAGVLAALERGPRRGRG